jgi:hypothetical protein
VPIEDTNARHPAAKVPVVQDRRTVWDMRRVRENRSMVVVAALVGIVLAGACSFDANNLRARPHTNAGATDSGGADVPAMDLPAAEDRPMDRAFGSQDSIVEVYSEDADTTPTATDAAETEDGIHHDTEDTVQRETDTSVDLPADTSDTSDTGGAGGGADDAGAEGGTADGGANGSGGASGGAGGSGAGGAGTGGANGDGGGAGGAGPTGSGGATTTDASADIGPVSPPAGLVAWWKMDEVSGSATAADATGKGNNATLTGLNTTSAWTTGRSGGALKCDGSGSALVNNSASLNTITTGVTVSAWAYRPSATTGKGVVLSREVGTTFAEHYWLGISGDNVGFSGSSGNVISNTAVPIGVWTHLAVTHDGTTVRIYVNGAQVYSNLSNGVFKADTSKLTICGNQNDTSGAITERWNGLVDDLQLYSRALMATEVAALAK